MKKRIFLSHCTAFFTAFVLLAESFNASSQTVSGKVISQKNEPLAEATFRIRDSENLTKTNEQGVFSFSNISGNNIRLIISFVGNETKEVVYSDGVAMVVTLADGATRKDKAIVACVIKDTAGAEI